MASRGNTYARVRNISATMPHWLGAMCARGLQVGRRCVCVWGGVIRFGMLSQISGLDSLRSGCP